MANIISDETIEYVGILAKLELSGEEKEAAKKDMARMLDYIDRLNELDTTGVEPMSHVFPVNNVFREDVVMVELGKKIRSGEGKVLDAVNEALARIETFDKQLNCYVTVDAEGARKRAEEVQKAIDAGELTGPLAGVPVAIKDNMCTEGLLTTCSSKILYNFKPTYTAEAVKNLEKAGAVIIGKTNMDEFAMGSTTETSAFGVTKNPWDTAHVRQWQPRSAASPWVLTPAVPSVSPVPSAA